MGTIKFFSAKQYSARLKATIQSSGKLGFTDETAKELALSAQTYVRLGIDESDSETLYLVVCESTDEDAFKVCKAGEYYYLPTATLFRSLGFDFKNRTIIFDLTRSSEFDDEFSGKVYKLNKRELDKRRKKMM